MKLSASTLLIAGLISGFQEGSEQEARRFVEGLRSDGIEEREQAASSLKALGRAALPLLEKTALDPDPEVAKRARDLTHAVYKAILDRVASKLTGARTLRVKARFESFHTLKGEKRTLQGSYALFMRRGGCVNFSVSSRDGTTGVNPFLRMVSDGEHVRFLVDESQRQEFKTPNNLSEELIQALTRTGMVFWCTLSGLLHGNVDPEEGGFENVFRSLKKVTDPDIKEGLGGKGQRVLLLSLGYAPDPVAAIEARLHYDAETLKPLVRSTTFKDQQGGEEVFRETFEDVVLDDALPDSMFSLKALDDVAGHLIQGDKQWADADADGACMSFTRAIELDSFSIFAHKRRGQVRHHMQDYTGALQDLTRAIEINPEDATLFVERAGVRCDRREAKEAIADLVRALEMDPTSGIARFELGRANILNADFKGARKAFDEALKAMPPWDDAYCQRGLLRRRMGDLDGAVEDFKKAIEIGPSRSLGFYQLGCEAYDRQAWDESRKYLEQASALSSSDQEDCTMRLWAIQFHTGGRNAADGELRKFRAKAEKSAGKAKGWPQEILSYLAGTLSEEELFKGANRGEMAASNYRRSQAHLYVGTSRQLTGDKAGALAHFKECVTLGLPTDPEVLSATAELDRAKGRK